jgi:hypothetical protein
MDVDREHWAELLLSEPFRLGADVDSSLEEHIFNVKQRQWDLAYDLGR